MYTELVLKAVDIVLGPRLKLLEVIGSGGCRVKDLGVIGVEYESDVGRRTGR